MKYARQCMSILILKYRRLASSKMKGERISLLESLGKSYLHKKQIMLVHIIYVMGNVLQWAELY